MNFRLIFLEQVQYSVQRNKSQPWKFPTKLSTYFALCTPTQFLHAARFPSSCLFARLRNLFHNLRVHWKMTLMKIFSQRDILNNPFACFYELNPILEFRSLDLAIHQEQNGKNKLDLYLFALSKKLNVSLV